MASTTKKRTCWTPFEQSSTTKKRSLYRIYHIYTLFFLSLSHSLSFLKREVKRVRFGARPKKLFETGLRHVGNMARKRTRFKILSIDPFDVSSNPTPAQTSWAEWFKEITKDVNPPYHIRRIHYRTLGKLKPDGLPYENTDNDSALMGKASEYARYLGLIPFDAIEDHKNEGETVSVVYLPDEVSVGLEMGARNLAIPTIDDASDTIHDFRGGSPIINYGVAIRQPYHLEIWIEKSTMNDVLIPIAKEFGAGLYVAGGQFSLTNIADLFKRIRGLKKPVRLFYLRDFDPAGQTMAKAVARKIEWFVRKQQPELDLKLFDVALTHQQCLEYQLPRSPMDREERYKGKFEVKFGEGATELDALEALRPGALADIVKGALQPYFDEDLADDIKDLEESEEERFEGFREGIIEDIVRTNRERLDPLIAEYNDAVTKADEIGSEIEKVINSADLDGDFELEYPKESSVRAEEEMEPVVDTTLSFEEAMERYGNGDLR